MFGPIIEQVISKGYSMFVYDYKYPDMTTKVFNELLQSWPKKKRRPQFCTIDFNDPRRSCRCNPLAPHLLEDPSHAFALAETVMLNIKKNNNKKMKKKVICPIELWARILSILYSTHCCSTTTG